MYFPPEVQIDIFKYLNFTQLFSIKRTNRYFKNFIDEYELALAKIRFFRFEILYLGAPEPDELFKPKPELYDFELSEQLEKKWKDAIKKSIPMYKNIINSEIRGNVVFCESEKAKYTKYLQLPNLPKNIEEMKIARYVMEQLFKCVFDCATFSNFIFNPEMIEILFDENKTKIPLKIHSRDTHLSVTEKHIVLKFVFNHLISNGLDVYFRREENYIEQSILLRILASGGKSFFHVRYLHIKSSGLYNIVKQFIETSKDCSKMVSNIVLHFDEGFHINLDERAENVESSYKKYQLSNKYNPKVKFSLYNYRPGSVFYNIIIKMEKS